MSKIRRRQRCPKCGSLDIIRWGTRNNHQRYKCSNCGSSFIRKQPTVSSANRFIWFRKWILGKQTIQDIAEDSGYSERHLRRWFDDYLSQSPKWEITRHANTHILIDGTWLDSDHCLILYRDSDLKTTIYYSFAETEDEYEIIKDLQALKTMRLRISSFTSDGSEDIIRAIKYCYPHIDRQRCVVHIERECLSWLTQHPKTSAGITLRRLVCQISHIKTSNDKLFWIKQIREWHDEYEEFIKQKTINKETGEMTYTHDNVRRTYIHIKRALPNMFKYIDNPSIPNNTNSLESFFGHLKDNLRIHRGMSVEHRQNFIKWYLFFCNEKKKERQVTPARYTSLAGCDSTLRRARPNGSPRVGRHQPKMSESPTIYVHITDIFGLNGKSRLFSILATKMASYVADSPKNGLPATKSGLFVAITGTKQAEQALGLSLRSLF